jgi:hypothetical protein
MRRKNPLNPSLGDLIVEQNRLVGVMKNTYPGKIVNHLMTPLCAQHRIACAETILRLLKKAKKDPQTNLIAEIEKAYPSESLSSHSLPVRPEHLPGNEDTDVYTTLDPY